MSGDTTPTLTGDDFANLMGTLGINGLKSQHWQTINKIIHEKKYILTALEEYPKLKNEVEKLRSTHVPIERLKQLLEIEQENQKLKAENEEMFKAIQKLHSAIKIWSDSNNKIQQENESLKQLIKLEVESIIKQLDEAKIAHGNERSNINQCKICNNLKNFKQFLQHLLKDDTK